MMVGIVFLVVFFSAAVMPGQSQSCSIADWLVSFDNKGVSKCQNGTEYIRGFYRNPQEDDDPISLLEEAKCCSRDVAFSDSPSQVVYADWYSSFDKNYRWNSCPPGFFLQGLYRGGAHSERGGLESIEDGVCSKPATHPRYYGPCVKRSLYSTSEEKGWSEKGWKECQADYFLTGLKRGSCGSLNCLAEFRCCKMAPGPAPLTSHDEVKTRVMDTTMAEISLLAHFLGYGWCGGCRSPTVGQDFKRVGDTWVADKTRRCKGYKSETRLNIKYDDWSYELKNIKFGEPVITELAPQVVDSGTITNNDKDPSTVTVERSQEVVRTVTHTTTSTWKSHLNIGLETGYNLPKGGVSFKSSFNFGYENSTSINDSTGKQQKTTFRVNEQKTIDAHSAVRWKLILSKTRTTVAYTATVIPRFSAELRGFLRYGGDHDDVQTNYHHKYRGKDNRPDLNYRFGNSSRPFYLALKQESDQSSLPWLWMDMKDQRNNSKNEAQNLIDSLTNENRYEFTLTGKFDDVSGNHVDFSWEEVPFRRSVGRRRRSSAPHNETVTVVKTVAKTEAWDPPPVFPDPPQVLLDPGTPFEVTEPMIDDV